MKLLNNAANALLVHAMIYTSSIPSFYVKAQQLCRNTDSESGKITTDSDDIVTFQRRGQSQCGCSYAEVKCHLLDDDGNPTDKDCNDYTIDARSVVNTKGYPNVPIYETLRVCNYNYNGNEILLNSNKTKLEFYFKEDKPKLLDQSYGSGSIGSNAPCKEIVGKRYLPAKRALYYMRATLQGPQVRSGGGARVNDGFCYAYAFKQINFKYDYGLGKCKVSTQLSCRVTSTKETCEQHIENNPDVCTPFQATIFAKACNDNEREILLQTGMSNFKYNTNLTDPKTGKLIRIKEKLPFSLDGGECKKFSTEKTINPCEKNFHQVKIQGLLYNKNEANAWFYKDRDCADFSYVKLDPPGGVGRGEVLMKDLTKIPTMGPTMIPTRTPNNQISMNRKNAPSKAPTGENGMTDKGKGNGKGSGKKRISGRGKRKMLIFNPHAASS